MTPRPILHRPQAHPGSVPRALPRLSALGLAMALAALALRWSSAPATGEIASTGPRPTGAAHPATQDPAGPRHPVRIRRPITTPRVETGLRDAHGASVTTSCATCHATSKPRPETDTAEQLDEFHQGLVYAHGRLNCLSCHHAGNYDRLRLADGRELDFADALVLCAQCHGPQYRDYQHGSHGGMTGYWDLKRGPRDRNHCVDCHDPHAPAYPRVRPTFAPRPDRGLQPSALTPTHP